MFIFASGRWLYVIIVNVSFQEYVYFSLFSKKVGNILFRRDFYFSLFFYRRGERGVGREINFFELG